MFCIRAQTLVHDSRTIATHMLTNSRPDLLYGLHSWRFSDIMGSKWYILRSTPWTNFIQRLVHLILHASNALSTIEQKRWWIAGLSRSCRDFSVCFSETHEVISDLGCKICAENGHRRNLMFCIRAQTLLLDSRTIATHPLTISRPDRLYWLHSWRFSEIMGSKWYILRSTPWTKFHSTPCAPNSTCLQCSLNYRSNRRWWIAVLSRSCRDFTSASLKLIK